MAYIEFVVTARKATGSSPANRGPSAPPTLPQDDAQPASGQPLAGCSFMARNRSTGELAGPALGNARAPEHRRVPLSVGGVEASATSRPAGENPRTERLAERSPALVSWPCQALRRDIAHSNAPQGPGARPTVAEFRRMHAPARSRTVGANAPHMDEAHLAAKRSSSRRSFSALILLRANEFCGKRRAFPRASGTCGLLDVTGQRLPCRREARQRCAACPRCLHRMRGVTIRRTSARRSIPSRRAYCSFGSEAPC